MNQRMESTICYRIVNVCSNCKPKTKFVEFQVKFARDSCLPWRENANIGTAQWICRMQVTTRTSFAPNQTANSDNDSNQKDHSENTKCNRQFWCGQTQRSIGSCRLQTRRIFIDGDIVATIVSQSVDFDLRRCHSKRIEHFDASELLFSIDDEWIVRIAIDLIEKLHVEFNFIFHAWNEIKLVNSPLGIVFDTIVRHTSHEDVRDREIWMREMWPSIVFPSNRRRVAWTSLLRPVEFASVEPASPGNLEIEIK